MSRRHRQSADGVYKDTVLSLSPLGYWTFDETSGTTAHDLSGNGHDGTYEGSPVLMRPPLIHDGYAVKLVAASSQYVDVSDQSPWQFTDAFSIAMWFMTEAAPGSTQGLIGQCDDLSKGWDAVIQTNGRPRIAVRGTDSIDTNNDAGMSVCDGDSHLIGWVIRKTGVESYIDGVKRATTSGTWTATADAADLLIGSVEIQSLHLDATLDGVAIFGRALSSGDMSRLYAAGLV